MPRVRVTDQDTFGAICWAWGANRATVWAHSENAALRREAENRRRTERRAPAGAPDALARSYADEIDRYVRADDQIFVPDEPSRATVSPGSSTVTLHGGRMHYLQLAYRNAFGSDVAHTHWEPGEGFGPNRNRLLQVYDYYAATYRRNRRAFLWAGLGKLAGATVIGGLDLAELAGPRFTSVMVRIAIEIFWDVTWLHEAVLDDPRLARVLATQYAARPDRIRSDGTPVPRQAVQNMATGVRVDNSLYAYRFGDYGRAVAHMLESNDQGPYYGNLAMLATEQWVNIQPWYDVIRASNEATWLSHASGMTRNVHPYHRDFVVDTQGAIGVAPDRWRWINDVPNAMWPQWCGLPESERDRLVDIPMEQLIQRRWEPILADRMAPGTQY